MDSITEILSSFVGEDKGGEVGHHSNECWLQSRGLNRVSTNMNVVSGGSVPLGLAVEG